MGIWPQIVRYVIMLPSHLRLVHRSLHLLILKYRISPFVPPRQAFISHAFISHARPVDISTRDSAHILSTANMPTNAETVLETTHSQIVHHHDPSNNNNNNFYPLPNCVVTPINVNKLSEYLVNHPDINFVNFLIDGFSNGFSIGY